MHFARGDATPYSDMQVLHLKATPPQAGRAESGDTPHRVEDWRLSWMCLVMEQAGSVVIVMARVLGLLWMRNPLAIVHQSEQRAPVPACGVRSGREQPRSSKKGDALHAARPDASARKDRCQRFVLRQIGRRAHYDNVAGCDVLPDHLTSVLRLVR